MENKTSIPVIDQGEDWCRIGIIRAVAWRLGVAGSLETDSIPLVLMERINAADTKVSKALEKHLEAWRKKDELLVPQLTDSGLQGKRDNIPNGYLDLCWEFDTSRSDLVLAVDAYLKRNSKRSR